MQIKEEVRFKVEAEVWHDQSPGKPENKIDPSKPDKFVSTKVAYTIIVSYSSIHVITYANDVQGIIKLSWLGIIDLVGRSRRRRRSRRDDIVTRNVRY